MPSARPWKVATFFFGGLSAFLVGVVALQSSGRVDFLGSVTRSGAAFSGASGPATIKVGEFKGAEPLTVALRDLVGKRLASSGSLSYSAPGVTGLVVGGNIADKVTPGEGATPTRIEVKVSLFVTKEPGSSLLSILSSTAALDAGGTPTPAQLDGYRMQAMTAAANSVYDDFLTVVR